MPTQKNKFKIGRKNSSKNFSASESKNPKQKKTSPASNQPSKKRNKATNAAKPPGNANTANAPAAQFFGKKAPYSKTKKSYPANRTANADILVKRNAYSKTARAAVLADAAARQRLIEIGGENTINIIREFDVDMSDDELAKKTGIKPSEVRVVLNRLHNKGVFAYTRVRDRDSGWYSYIWKMDEERLKDVGGATAVEETTQAISKEGYRCTCCSQQNMMDFSDAVDARFRCGSCGGCLEYFDSRKNKIGNL